MNFDALDKLDETKWIVTYIKLIRWMIENDIEKEDLALACKAFLNLQN